MAKEWIGSWENSGTNSGSFIFGGCGMKKVENHYINTCSNAYGVQHTAAVTMTTAEFNLYV